MSPAREPDRIAVVIPVYNHEGNVRAVVRKAARLGVPVIVVDDGATDGSYEQIRDLPDIRTLRHPENRGKGAALLTGFAEAARFARWAVAIDADGQHDPAEVPEMIKKLPEDGPLLLVGRRQAMKEEKAPWTSRFGREFSNFWVWVSGGPRMTDSQSGFRIYPLPETLELNVKARRFQFEVEVLVKAERRGIPVAETPVSVSYHPGMPRVSHFRPFKDFMRNSAVFTRLICQRIFCPPSVRKRM